MGSYSLWLSAQKGNFFLNGKGHSLGNALLVLKRSINVKFIFDFFMMIMAEDSACFSIYCVLQTLSNEMFSCMNVQAYPW